MVTNKMFSGKELEDPEKHVRQFKLNVFSKKLSADGALNLHARFGYFAETLTDTASEWFDSLVVANNPDMHTLYDALQTRFAFNVSDQWRENQIF